MCVLGEKGGGGGGVKVTKEHDIIYMARARACVCWFGCGNICRNKLLFATVPAFMGLVNIKPSEELWNKWLHKTKLATVWYILITFTSSYSIPSF